jgi:hypothetical protein
MPNLFVIIQEKANLIWTQHGHAIDALLAIDSPSFKIAEDCKNTNTLILKPADIIRWPGRMFNADISESSPVPLSVKQINSFFGDKYVGCQVG